MRLEIHGAKIELDDELKDYTARRLRSALGRLAGRVARVTVRMSDVNGPRGGIDKRCRIAISLVPRGEVMVEGSGRDPFLLVAREARRIGRSVRRELGRRRHARA